MKIVLVWPAKDPLRSISVRYERYVKGFRLLGYEAVTVCLPSAVDGYIERVVVAANEQVLCNPEFYRSMQCDAGLVITWLGLPNVVQAMKAAIPWVVSVADSDGLIGTHVHSAATFRRAVFQHSNWELRLRAIKYWLQQYFINNDLIKVVFESASAADRIIMASPYAVDNLKRFFRYYHREELAAKVIFAAYPVDDDFLNGPVPAAWQRENRVVAIGRWDDPQKDADLLAASINMAAIKLPSTEFVIVGRNGSEVTRRCKRLKDLGEQPPSKIAELLRTSRLLLLTSRWEGAPIVAFEAICSGTTVVGPSWVPACQWIAPNAGTLFCRRSASSVKDALLRELLKWDCGERDPSAIAKLWRPYFNPVQVCQDLLPPFPVNSIISGAIDGS
jgi:glycosyltransferase involved in cell wall biosynthesis